GVFQSRRGRAGGGYRRPRVGGGVPPDTVSERRDAERTAPHDEGGPGPGRARPLTETGGSRGGQRGPGAGGRIEARAGRERSPGVVVAAPDDHLGAGPERDMVPAPHGCAGLGQRSPHAGGAIPPSAGVAEAARDELVGTSS